MKQYRKLALPLACVLFLSGCGAKDTDISLADGTEETELEVSWWGTDERNSYTMEALKEYDSEHPEIKINMTYGEFSGFEQKNDVKMFSKNEADVMQVDFKWLSKYEKQGLDFYDLNELSDVIDLSQYDENELSFGQNKEGKQVALPIATNAKVAWYNQSIFDSYGLSLPETWDDLFAAAAVMQKDGVYPLDMDDSGVWMACVAHQEQVTGRPAFDENEKFAFTQQDVTDMLSFYMEMLDKKVLDKPLDRDDQKVGTGEYAGTLQWVSGAAKYEEMITKNGQTVKAALAPTISGAKRTGWYAKPATLYVIGANTEHPKEAAELLSYMVEDKGMVLRQKLEKGVPCNAKAIELLDEAGELAGTQYEATLLCEEKGFPLMNPYFELNKYYDALCDAGDEILYNHADLASAAAKAYAAMIEPN